VLDHLGIARTRYFGFSMGGQIGFALAKLAPERLEALILGGASPYPAPATDNDWLLETLYGGEQALCQLFGEFLTPALAARLRAADRDVLIACRRRWLGSPGFADVLADITVPTLVFGGDADPVHEAVRESATRIPGARFVSLPGLRHIETMCRSERVLPHVERFLAGLAPSWPCERGGGSQAGIGVARSASILPMASTTASKVSSVEAWRAL